MKALAFGAALVLCAPAVANAAQMTPLEPGFHQSLSCSGGGRVDIRVGTEHPKLVPEATVVTTTLTSGDRVTTTDALRMSDASGNIYALGYVFPSFVKRFPKRILLPASPPRPGSRTMYYNLSGAKVEKRFEGMKAALTAGARTGYMFSDYLDGRRLNSVTYVPGVGLTKAAFTGLAPGRTDLVCHSPGY